jgi:5-formyltetrahydrofolate cyclo-ligase
VLSASGEDHGRWATGTYDRRMSSDPASPHPTPDLDDGHVGDGAGDAGPGATKRDARNGLLARRRSLTDGTVASASQAIVDRLRTLPDLAGRRQVLLYASDPDEVSLDDLLDDPPAGWTVLLPRVVDGTILAVPHAPRSPLVTGYRGIREPSGVPIDPATAAATIDAVIVPGVAFTAAGARLGRGAGLYDRLLTHLTAAVRIGVCMEAFVVAHLPIEPHDVEVDVLVTDASVRRRAHGGGAAPA